MMLPNEDQPSDARLSGIVLLREFNDLLPQAKIYIKSGGGLLDEVSNFIRSYKSVAGLLTIDISKGVHSAADKIRAQLKGWWGMPEVDPGSRTIGAPS
jgi:hypothetical protein